MKFLFDQNISHRILNHPYFLESDSTSVKSEKLIDATDKEIWDFAKKTGYTIVTQDSDFNDLNSLHGYPPKIIWIRTGNNTTAATAELLKNYENEIIDFINNEDFGCFEIFSLSPS
jgi:predicted nuclease of predicted toxin-antitoxin system